MIEEIGRGGMGAVYVAEDTRLGRRVAIKVLPELKAADAEARARFLSEAKAVSALEHPHICMLYEFDEAEGQPFIAMQLVEGETLKDAVKREPLDEPRVREIVTAISDALSVAHAKGVVHRDVKSENILLGRDGSIKLTDFGIARLQQEPGLTSPSMVVGTPHVMSPEQIGGQQAGAASDQFALGVVAYECLTGALPFAGDTLGAIVHAVLNAEPDAPSRRRSDIAPAWDAVLARALSKDPQERFDSVAAFAQAVRGTAPVAPSGHGGTRSIAVLYFDNLSSDPDSDYFCAGITEDLLTDLSKVEGLDVASRNAVGRYRGKSVDIAQVASELGVETVLEGSVRKAGNRVRINAQLIKASDGFHLWAERYDRTLDDIFAVQDDITGAIAEALRGALTPKEAEERQTARPESAEAYDLYLKAKQLYERYEKASMLESIEHLEQAVAIEPTYALAWAGIANACGQMHDKSWDLDPAWIERGRAAAGHAVALGPDLAEAYKARSLIEKLGGDSEASDASLRKALEIDPGHLGALVNLGVRRVDAGDLAGGERCLRRVMTLDPALTFAPALLMFLLRLTRREDEALALTHRVQASATSSFYHQLAYLDRTLIHTLNGRIDQAASEIRDAERGGLHAHAVTAAKTLLAVLQGKPMAYGLSKMELEGWSPFLMFYAVAAAAAGDAAEVVRTLKASETFDPHTWTSLPVLVRLDPGYRGIRDAAVFREWLGDRGNSLVWPAEAPPIPDEDRAMFAEVKVESGLPPDEGIP